MNEEFLHAALEALKEEILSSLHCALPGTVQSFDPAAQTVSVLPALRRRDASGVLLPAPLLRDVPVFYPGTRQAGMTWPVSAGDECLVIFSDACMDGWFDTAQATLPPSPRKHDLSDAFALVGFRSRPNALPAVPEEPAFFGRAVPEVDAAFIPGSVNPVQSRVIREELDDKMGLHSTYATVIRSGADLNDLYEPGDYYSATSAVTNSLSNCPFTGIGFRMFVHRTAQNYYRQTILRGNSLQTYFRTFHRSGSAAPDSFGAWSRFLTETV